MMPTQSAGAGSFAQFDLSRVPSPCFVIDSAALRRNLEILAALKVASGVQILLALKAFSTWSLAPLISDYLDGTCASGLWEAQLARAHYRGTLATYAPAYRPSDIAEIAALSDHMIFNTPAQIDRFSKLTKNTETGLRINPQLSQMGAAKYDPCAPHSRLGFPLARFGELSDMQIDALNGIHIHALCEQDFPPLARVVEAARDVLAHLRGRIDWLNLGGGHLITSPHYQRDDLAVFLRELQQNMSAAIYLELGTAVVFDAGILIGEVLDITDNEGAIAITDISPSCHMPDVLEAPYRPALLGEADEGEAIQLAGASCLAGDVIGTYRFARPLEVGMRLAFLDQAHYSMVKMTSFNGVQLPALAIWDSERDVLTIQREFSFDDFVTRLS